MRRFFSTQTAKAAEWWHWLTESERERAKLGIGLLVLLAIGWPAYHYSGPLWRKWRHDQALVQAREYTGRRDYRGALLALRRATEIDPNHLNTWREVARYLAEVGSPESVVAHQNMVRLAPQDMALRTALVQEAIRFGNVGVAKEAFAGIDAASRQDAAFHRIAAAVALAMGRTADLEAHLAKLVSAEPGNRAARFNLAAVRLWGEDQAAATAAVDTMRILLGDPAVRVRAALELLKYVARRGEPARVDATVAELLRIFAAEAGGPARATSAGGEPPGWFVLVAALQAASAAVPDDAALMIRWMSDLRLHREALIWHESLAESVRRMPAVAAAAAETAAVLGDNDRLGRLLRTGAWGAIPDDALELALTSRLQRTRYNEARGRSTWEDAIAACADSLTGLSVLARLASNWRDAAGLEQALQALISRYPKQLWAYDALRSGYAARRETEKLWQLHGRWVKVASDDATVRQTWLLLSAILNRVNEEIRLAARVEQTRSPEDPVAVAAAAAVLWRSGKSIDGVLLLEGLPAGARSHPQVNYWMAVLLAERARRSDARPALLQAWRLALWPEEIEILRRAATKVGLVLPPR